ncbi:hypothetical protein ABS71_11800 [bacterium SCN 62-11]|nr:hypothetical protein [Candidatus Eremiobacteraeota bacterium]ODT66132.1 MAG: hypothetical protein ABS71_11800 [bacterium SCN 62-11]
MVDLDSSRGCSAAYLQLRDVATAAAGGRLQGVDLENFLEELRGYLVQQEERFQAYPDHPELPEFAEALDQIQTGLEELRSLVEEALENHPQMSSLDWASLLDDGGVADDQLRQGVEMLDRVEAP